MGAETVKQVFDLTDSMGRHVRIKINSNYGDTLLQVGEFAFGTADLAVVPEPLSIAMFGIGALGLFGYSRRRRQTSVAA